MLIIVTIMMIIIKHNQAVQTKQLNANIRTTTAQVINAVFIQQTFKVRHRLYYIYIYTHLL